MKDKIPQLYFKYAYPLDSDRRRLFEKKAFGSYPNIDEVKKGVEHVETLWKEANTDDRIMKKLHEYTRALPERALVCYMFGRGLGAMSTPFLLPLYLKKGDEKGSDEEFVTVIIHELAHLFVSNKKIGIKEHVRSAYKDEPVKVQNHIYIFALLEKILPELYDKETVEELLEFSTEHPDYARALEIARDIGANILIEQLQEI